MSKFRPGSVLLQLPTWHAIISARTFAHILAYADHPSLIVFVFLEKSHLTTQVPVRRLWNRYYERQVHALLFWTSRLVCALRGLYR